MARKKQNQKLTVDRVLECREHKATQHVSGFEILKVIFLGTVSDSGGSIGQGAGDRKGKS